MNIGIVTSNDLLVAFAFACPFAAIAILLSTDLARWLRGESSIKFGADETHLDDARGVRDSTGLSATLTTSAVGADTPYDWNTAA